jgi:hypothetical protein
MKKLIATMLTVALIGCETIPSTQDIASLATATSVPPPTKKMSRSEQEFYNTRVYAASLPPEERRAFAQAYMQEFAARRAAQAQIAAAVIQGAAVANAGFQVSNAINQASWQQSNAIHNAAWMQSNATMHAGYMNSSALHGINSNLSSINHNLSGLRYGY